MRDAFERSPIADSYLVPNCQHGDDVESAGVILFLCSALATHGIDAVRNEADVSEEVSMVAAHGYCSQEAVNLLLTGTANSNVFDSSKCLGSDDSNPGLSLRGVQFRPKVGFLTLFEAFGSLEVGSHFKNPEWPVWVVHAESHYSVLFGLLPEDCNQDANLTSKTDLWYYDPLGRQDEEKRITVLPSGLSKAPEEDDLEINGMIAKVVRTRWGLLADLDWNGAEPIY